MPTLDQLNALADAVPVLNQKAAQAAQANAAVQQQQQIGQTQVAPGANVNRVAQAAAPEAIQQQAAPMVAEANQTAKQLTDVGQAGVDQVKADAKDQLDKQEAAQRLQVAGAQNAATLGATRNELAMRKKVTATEQASAKRLSTMGIELDNQLQLATIRQRQQLEQLGGDVKQEILDSRLQFERDDMGRKFTNERQLADYSLATAKSQEDWQMKSQQMTEASNRKVQLLEASYKTLMNLVQNEDAAKNQGLDNEARYKLAQKAATIKEQLRQQEADAKNRAQVWGALGGLAGAVIGGLTLGPAGAVAGYGIGSGAATAAAGATQQQEAPISAEG